MKFLNKASFYPANSKSKPIITHSCLLPPTERCSDSRPLHYSVSSLFNHSCYCKSCFCPHVTPPTTTHACMTTTSSSSAAAATAIWKILYKNCLCTVCNPAILSHRFNVWLPPRRRQQCRPTQKRRNSRVFIVLLNLC